jgi:histidyl-tRNA synthetase
MKQNTNMKLPFRRYQIGEVFRDEPIGKGRFRQFVQCDVDIVGDPSIDADAECLLIVKDVLDELKIKSEIQINNRKLLKAIIESVQIMDVKNVMRELDKVDKLGIDNVKSNLRKYADPNQILTLFKLLERDIPFFMENAFDGAEDVLRLVNKCREYGVNVKLNTCMARGLGYYTGNIFEVKVDNHAIAAGGRYDKTVGKFVNREIPAVGIAFGLERVSELAHVNVEATKVLLISIDKDKATSKLAKALRKEGISCLTTSDKPGKALEFANSLGIQNVVFIGEMEVQKNRFKLRDMKSGEEKLFSESKLISTFKK